MRRIPVIFAMAFTLTLISAAAAFGQAAGGIVIPVDTYIAAEPGSLTEIASVQTPPDLIGSTCRGVAVAENGESVHEFNDIIITSGSTSATLVNVEGESFKVTPAIGDISLGETVTLTLRMGPDGVFSGGLAVFIDVDCNPPTTTTTTTTTTIAPPVTQPPVPMIEIDKYAPTADNATSEFGFYGADGVGTFTIVVHNNGTTPLTDVTVTDELLEVGDKTAECGKVIGDLAVDETVSYTCTIAGLDYANGIFYDNEATVVGFGPNDQSVTDTDPATVSPVKDTTVTTAAPTTTQAPATTQATTTTSASTETLPVTGASTEQMRGLGIAGIALVLAGIVALGGATLVGQYRKEN